MAKRYELSEEQYRRLRDILPGKAGDPGRTAQDNHRFINGVLWVLRSGAHWHDMPERYGNWKSLHKRFSRWAQKGVWEAVFRELLNDPKNDYVMIDSTLVKAHQQATTGKRGRPHRRWGDPGED
jgi:transposase